MPDKKILYGWRWAANHHPLSIEMECVRRGGRWKCWDGSYAGMGLEYHFKRGLALTWPHLMFHRWFDMFIKEFLTRRTVGVIGPASSGKSLEAAACGLFDYYCYPFETTGMYCSTTRELLQQRIWGEVVDLHNKAVKRHLWLPGVLIESRLRIVTNPKDSDEEDRNVKNGLLGIPCKRGESFVGLGDFVGIKNKRVRLYGDELSLLPRVFVDAISNLDKNPDFKAIGMGNPKDVNDALGLLCEPKNGGWEIGIDQDPVSKVWETKRPDGVCIQYVGSDSPNLDGKLGIPLITQEAIDRDIAFYGKDSLQYTMMNQGMMPRGQGSRRVLSRQLIEQHGAKGQPMWMNTLRTRIAMLDAAFGGVGGDRPILKFAEFGEEVPPSEPGTVNMSAFVSQPDNRGPKRMVFAITETLTVPIINGSNVTPEDQIATYCKTECEKRGITPEHFGFDSAMRASLVQSFMRIWSIHVVAIDSGGAPTERPVSHDIDVPANKYYRKLISEFWFAVRWTVLSNQMRGMTAGEIEEFCSREWGLVGANLTEVETKADMKKKIGRSPDEADAVVIGLELARRLGFEIRKLKPAKEPEQDDRWKREMKDKARDFWRSGQLTHA